MVPLSSEAGGAGKEGREGSARIRKVTFVKTKHFPKTEGDECSRCCSARSLRLLIELYLRPGM